MNAFLERLASRSVTPGGGSAAAVTAAVGIALIEMTAGINEKKRHGRKPSAHLKRIRRRLLRLAAEDAEAFLEFSSIRRKGRHGANAQKALRRCAEVPFAVCGYCEEGLRLAAREVPRTGRWLASDLAEAALFLEAAFRAARWNVEANLRNLSDGSFAVRRKALLKAMAKTCASLKRSTLKKLRFS